jgi:glycine cleavage system H lipoate-binding protein
MTASFDWNCVNIVTVASITLGIAGFVIGVLGYRASARGVRLSIEAGAREKTAQQAASAARQDLLFQRAAEDFRAIGENVERLTRAVTMSSWKEVQDVLVPLKRQLAEANGSFQNILKGIDMDKLDGAILAVKRLVKAAQEFPTGERAAAAAVPAETVQAMIVECGRIGGLVGEIYGKLKYLKVEDVQ